jgi:hypothetical protein
MMEREYPYVDEHEYNCAFVKKEKPRVTCIDKLRLERPMWSEQSIEDAVNWDCPSDYDILPDPKNCMNGAISECPKCWNREIKEWTSNDLL